MDLTQELRLNLETQLKPDLWRLKQIAINPDPFAAITGDDARLCRSAMCYVIGKLLEQQSDLRRGD